MTPHAAGKRAALAGAAAQASSRRRALARLAGAAAALGGAAFGLRGSFAGEADGRVIEIEARRFRFTPNEIVVKRGEAVTLAFRSVDFVHGFNLPDFGMRADLVPGTLVKVRLRPTRAGRFTFLCDNFCGDGHEEMNGTLVVEA